MSTESLETKDNRGDRKKKGEEVGKVEWEADNLHRPNQSKRAERDYTNEALALLNHIKAVMNLWKALMSALNTEFKSSNKAPAKSPQFTKG